MSTGAWSWSRWRSTDIRDNESDKELYRVGLIVLIILGVLGGIYLIADSCHRTLPCLLHFATGLYCPGCGGTRAVKALFHGHLIRSFIYHPVVPYGAVMCLLFFGSHTLENLHVPHIRGMRFKNIYVWILLGLAIAGCIIKNILLVGFDIDILSLFSA